MKGPLTSSKMHRVAFAAILFASSCLRLVVAVPASKGIGNWPPAADDSSEKIRRPWDTPVEDTVTQWTTVTDGDVFPERTTEEDVEFQFPAFPLPLQADHQANKSLSPTHPNSDAAGGNDDNHDLSTRQYPPQVAPCTCYYQESCGCVCREPISWEDFQMLPQNFRSCPGFTLALRGGIFHSFPADYFYRVGDVRDFVLDISRIEFEYLFDPTSETSAFNRVTFDTSAFIRIHQVAINRDWNWAGFYELAPTTMLAYCEIQIVESPVPILSTDFGTVCQGAVTAVTITSCGMMALENRVFLPFYKLNDVDLSNNRLRVLLRSYFSQPANELETISLAYNDIHALPRNMFSGMPSLKRVDLRGNPLTTLEEGTFRPIFRSVQIVGLETLPLNCDCRAKWMKEPAHVCGVNTYGLAATVCHSPRRLNGYSFFNDTLPKDLNCT